MTEWLTYTPSDFLLFTPQTYYRLFELYNRDIWPIQPAALLLGAAVVVLVFRKPARQGRIITAMLAACWFWVAWAYHLRHYATINWAATGFAAGFAIEGALLVWTGVFRDRLAYRAAKSTPNRLGLGLIVLAFIVYPFLAPLLGREWLQAELFGTAPDPTVIATLGLLLMVDDNSFWHLWIIPVIWCAVSGVTLWTMGSPEALLVPLTALAAVCAAGLKSFRTS